jgi:hypothetical protein
VERLLVPGGLESEGDTSADHYFFDDMAPCGTDRVGSGRMTETLTSRNRSRTVHSGIPSVRRPGREPLRLEPTRSRRPALAVGSVALVAACTALFALIYTHSTREISVIEVARPVMQGQLLTSSDIQEAQIGGVGGVELVPYADASQVVGKPAAVSLVTGVLLAPGDVDTSGSLARGEAVVGIDLKPGMLPASGVEPGETVMVVLTEPSGSPVSTQTSDRNSSSAAGGQQTSISPTVIGTATVVGVDDFPDDSSEGDVVVSVELSAEVAPVVADASAAGQAALVEVAPTS